MSRRPEEKRVKTVKNKLPYYLLVSDKADDFSGMCRVMAAMSSATVDV